MGQLQIASKITSQNFLIEYGAPEMELIRKTYAAKATPAEFELFLYQSRVYGLDILTRKIWCVKYGDAPAQIYAGRDGFLEIAHRDPNFDGMETFVEETDKPFSLRVSNGFRSGKGTAMDGKRSSSIEITQLNSKRPAWFGEKTNPSPSRWKCGRKSIAPGSTIGTGSGAP
jgi:hypothetical protein